MNINELLENGAELDKNWNPCKYREATKKVAEEK